MDHPQVAARALRRAAVWSRSRALAEASIVIRQESRAAIETSKVRVTRSRMEMARLDETRRNLVIRRHVTRGGGDPAPGLSQHIESS